MDDASLKYVFGVVGTAVGAVATGFFRWLIDRSRQQSDDARYESMERRFDGIDKNLSRCRKREHYFRSLHEQGLVKIKELETTNTKQQAQIDLMQKDMTELRRSLESTLIKLSTLTPGLEKPVIPG